MSDSFEKFMRDNRREFDTASPSGEVWKNVERNLPGSVKRFSLRDVLKWSAAAAIVFAALTSIYFLSTRKHSHETPDTSTTVNSIEKSVSPAYASQFEEVYRWIGERQEALKESTAGNPELYSQFQKDLAALDSAYRLLLAQRAHSPNKDLITEAMIQNLRLQAALLSRQLTISDQLNNHEKKKTNETSI